MKDCGGALALEKIAVAFEKKSEKAYRSFCEWLGTRDLDLSSFDMDDMNFRLNKPPRIFSEIYEKGFEPTQLSIDLVLRKFTLD